MGAPFGDCLLGSRQAPTKSPSHASLEPPPRALPARCTSERAVPDGLQPRLPRAPDRHAGERLDGAGHRGRPLDATPILLGGTDAPKIFLRGADLGLANYTNCEGHPGGDPCGIDVDAYSDGLDAILKSMSPVPDWRLFFTVDEYARGNLQTPVDPSVRSEGLAADVSGDVWCTIYLPPPPLGPNTTAQWARVHALTVDGDGRESGSGAIAPGHAMVEPNIPGQGLPNAAQDTGSHIDALHIGESPSFVNPKYFSLDASFTDPFGYVNSGSAAAEGVSPSDVLLSVGGTISVYASATTLGLEVDLDDLDGLVINENGVAGYQRSKNPYDWETGDDMLLFSLRRGSETVGKIDSLLGLPIEPGDVLVPPVENGNGRPGILIAAEVLGLRTRRESGANEESDDLSGGSRTTRRTSSTATATSDRTLWTSCWEGPGTTTRTASPTSARSRATCCAAAAPARGRVATTAPATPAAGTPPDSGRG